MQAQAIDPRDYRVKWRGAIGSHYELWWHDDGYQSGGETKGWHLVDEFDARDTLPEVAAAEHAEGLQ